MEKYSKWDDPSNGLNPFTPLQPKKTRGPVASVFRFLVSAFFIVLRLPCIFLVLVIYSLLHALKFALLLPALIRLMERFIDFMCGKMVLNVTSFNNIKESYHKEDENFDFVKWQKGELSVTIQGGDVFVCNQTCFVDWLYLLHKYSPLFTQIVVVKKGGSTKAGLRVLSGWESMFAACGILFPEETTSDSGVFFSIKELKEQSGFLWYKGQRPVVVFPEGSKTNGLGILNIEKDIVDMIKRAGGLDENLRITAVRFDHTFDYYSAFNSTDTFGWSSLIGCICQFSSRYTVQYFHNVQGPLNECSNDEDRHDFVQKTLMIRRKEQSMKNSSWREHQQFIAYWKKTQGQKDYTADKKKK